LVRLDVEKEFLEEGNVFCAGAHALGDFLGAVARHRHRFDPAPHVGPIVGLKAFLGVAAAVRLGGGDAGPVFEGRSHPHIPFLGRKDKRLIALGQVPATQILFDLQMAPSRVIAGTFSEGTWIAFGR
jgi:hypothetical protein